MTTTEPYTPTTLEVRDSYAVGRHMIWGAKVSSAEDDFYRWFADVQAKAWDEGWGGAMDEAHPGGPHSPRVTNPYREVNS